jgi:hypothetical protein
MAITPTIKSQWFDGKRLWVHLSLAFSGSYVAGGDTLDMSKLGIQSSGVPSLFGGMNSQTASTTGTVYNWIPGTTQATGKVVALQGALAEVAAGAYPASITGDTADMLCYFKFNR